VIRFLLTHQLLEVAALLERQAEHSRALAAATVGLLLAQVAEVAGLLVILETAVMAVLMLRVDRVVLAAVLVAAEGILVHWVEALVAVVALVFLGKVLAGLAVIRVLEATAVLVETTEPTIS
jgi:hypothetical protein